MKATIEIDQKKLRKVMRLTGIKTQRAAIDFALDQAERVAEVERLFRENFFVASDGPVIDPAYDVLAIRATDMPLQQQKKPAGNKKKVKR